MNRVRILAALLAAACAAPAGANSEIQLLFTSPQPRSFYFPEFESIQYRSGWTLELLLRARERELQGVAIPTFGDPVGLYPEGGELSALVFNDDDDCLSLAGDSQTFGPDFQPCPLDPSERFVLFYPDLDHNGLVDQHGIDDLREALDDQETQPAWGGPVVVAGEGNGLGYGPNDDLPGLVLMSNVGVGIVYEPLAFAACQLDTVTGLEVCEDPSAVLLPTLTSWERRTPEARYNLAGLMNSVSFELRTQWGYSEITTSLQVPRFLFAHLAIHDPCSDSGGNCTFSFIGGSNRVDAGPINTPPQSTDTAQVELRAVVVNGRAPRIVEDCTGEGEVTAADLECLGYVLLSDEAIVEFEHRGQYIEFCANHVDPWTNDNPTPFFLGFDEIFDGGRDMGGTVFLADFDGEVTDNFALVCPPGGGGTLRPPR